MVGLTISAVTGQFFATDETGLFNIPAAQAPLFAPRFSGIRIIASPDTTTRHFRSIVLDRMGLPVGSNVAEGKEYQSRTGPLFHCGGGPWLLNVPAAETASLRSLAMLRSCSALRAGRRGVSGP